MHLSLWYFLFYYQFFLDGNRKIIEMESIFHNGYGVRIMCVIASGPNHMMMLHTCLKRVKGEDIPCTYIIHTNVCTFTI